MSNIDKQALRGQELTPRYYLAHCLECGVIMPSNKLIESRNYPDGDADCYCPHCNANDCDIDDLGTGEAPSVVAWNYQQKRIEALLDELEAAEKRIDEMEAREINLPPYSFFDFKQGSPFKSGAYCHIDSVNKELSKHGIKMTAAAGKGEAS